MAAGALRSQRPYVLHPTAPLPVFFFWGRQTAVTHTHRRPPLFWCTIQDVDSAPATVGSCCKRRQKRTEREVPVDTENVLQAPYVELKELVFEATATC